MFSTVYSIFIVHSVEYNKIITYMKIKLLIILFYLRRRKNGDFKKL